MQVEIIKQDPRIARIHYLDYRKKCRENREARIAALAKRAAQLDKDVTQVRLDRTRVEKEDEELLKAYRALYRGQQIIDLPKTIGAGGLDARKLPKLAVAQASAERCHFWSSGGILWMSSKELYSTWKVKAADAFRFGTPSVPAELTNGDWRKTNNLPLRATALVPSVPPHLRPANLDKYFILWEAEWTARAPVDPLLLSRVNDTMFAIVAQWDLTPLEQRVLEGRL